VNRYDGDKRTRTLKCWSQFGALLFGQLTGHNALRSISTALQTQSQFLGHLGLSPVKRSTLSDANESRNPKILEDVFYQLLNRTQKLAPKSKFRFKGKILAMDATTINLCLNLCPWAGFHHGKGGMKIHTAIDLDGNLPNFMIMTSAKVHDIKAARRVTFEPKTTVIADRAYSDFRWLHQLQTQGSYFVTRLKDNIQFKVRKSFNKISSKGIKADQEIRLTGKQTRKKYPITLRRISYCDSETKQSYVFITNRFDLAAKTICDLYKARWKVELFFKTLKGQLQIDKFVGTTVNAVLWQLWTAMIAYLLVSTIRFLNKVKWSVPSTMAALAVTLFQKTHLARVFANAPPERCINIGLTRQLQFQF
jgi:putative transposase